MAKKRGNASKKRKNTKEVAPQHELPGGFWRQVFAVVMIAVALFCVVTWFGRGGSILNKAHEWVTFAIGFAAYIVPILLVYLAVKIFRSENNQVSGVVWFASFLMIIWISGIAGIGNNGGEVGKWLNSLTTQVLDNSVVIFIYILLIFITVLFILQLSPLTFFRGTKNLVKHNKNVEQGESEEKPEKGGKLGKKLGDLEIKVNSGVAIADSAVEKKPVAAAKTPAPAPVEEKALVAVSDPNWKMPSLDLLAKKQSPADAGNIQQNAMIIRSTLADFGIEVEMEGANVGPRVTQYTMKPPAGVSLSKILTHDKELALNLAVKSVRIEAPIPGTSLVGVEIPNVKAADVRLRALLESPEWKASKDPLTFAVGKDISGRAVVANLAKMPHLLIAGTTGSGKSVMTNTMIVSLLYRNSPSDMKLIVIDPKQVEMVQYTDIPHLLAPIITDTQQAVSALKWAVNEMERRYTLLASKRVKNIVEYNKMVEAEGAKADGEKAEDSEEKKAEKMPYIVIIVDEMSDLMMQAGKELEPPIVRVAQKGRAAGLHLVLATQKPIVKVVTGLIKGNVPARISFAVGSTMDSIVMLDKGGAEKLLGSGDMLFLTTEMSGQPRRIQGAWVSDEEEELVAKFLKDQRPPEYNKEVVSQPVQIKGLGPSDGGSFGDLGRKYDPNDPIVRKAVEISLSKGKFSTAMLQTYLGKGHGFVSGLAIWFEEIGVIGAANGNKPRDLLITSMEEFDQITSAL